MCRRFILLNEVHIDKWLCHTHLPNYTSIIDIGSPTGDSTSLLSHVSAGRGCTAVCAEMATEKTIQGRELASIFVMWPLVERRMNIQKWWQGYCRRLREEVEKSGYGNHFQERLHHTSEQFRKKRHNIIRLPKVSNLAPNRMHPTHRVEDTEA